MNQHKIPFLNDSYHQQALSKLQSMTLEAKIGQLLGIAVWSNRDENYEKKLLEQVSELQPGGIIFFQGTPDRQRLLSHRIDEQLKEPALYSMDAEWGVSMRLDQAPGFPYNMTLGAIKDTALIYEISSEIAHHLKQLGVGMNYAPVVDINNNAANPVISFRAFGSDPELVIEKSLAYLKGHQDQGVLTVAKHFPGHGDTSLDSHLDLPVINKSKQELTQLELKPFLKLMEAGVGGIMTGHLHIPDLEPESNRAATLSANIVQKWLKDELNYQGLVITDALDMKGVTRYFEPGEVELQSFLAGNDVLLFPRDPQKAVEKIKQALEQGLIKEDTLEERVLKILKAKLWVHANSLPNDDFNSSDLWSARVKKLNQEAASKSITILKEDFHLRDGEKIVLIDLNLEANQGPYGALQHHDITKPTDLDTQGLKEKVFYPMQKSLPSASIDWIEAKGEQKLDELERVMKSQDDYKWLVIFLRGMPIKPINNFGLDQEIKAILDQYIMSGKGVLCLMGNVYALNQLKLWDRAAGVILTYQENSYAEPYLTDILLKNKPAEGSIPVEISN